MDDGDMGGNAGESRCGDSAGGGYIIHRTGVRDPIVR